LLFNGLLYVTYAKQKLPDRHDGDTIWSDLLYFEVGAYDTLSASVRDDLGSIRRRKSDRYASTLLAPGFATYLEGPLFFALNTTFIREKQNLSAS
jgi:hypothetical protein